MYHDDRQERTQSRRFAVEPAVETRGPLNGTLWLIVHNLMKCAPTVSYIHHAWAEARLFVCRVYVKPVPTESGADEHGVDLPNHRTTSSNFSISPLSLVNNEALEVSASLNDIPPISIKRHVGAALRTDSVFSASGGSTLFSYLASV